MAELSLEKIRLFTDERDGVTGEEKRLYEEELHVSSAAIGGRRARLVLFFALCKRPEVCVGDRGVEIAAADEAAAPLPSTSQSPPASQPPCVFTCAPAILQPLHRNAAPPSSTLIHTRLMKRRYFST